MIDIGDDDVGVLLDLSMSYGATNLLPTRLLAPVTGLVWTVISYANEFGDSLVSFRSVLNDLNGCDIKELSNNYGVKRNILLIKLWSISVTYPSVDLDVVLT